ncbi:2-dehydropantoate 2-reductase N-terminal domain-containing protein [Bacillus velezensis]|uniref:2-dehydropantoate 2-reductase N-terminal domain-containing protein n=1 Tax=Bacillus velezensis TaxID=492670 RepID=UPI001F5CD911|nr:2-dehydropantoate 2-reductase N-terminal domain-containing protein [Bacillus velezensis]BCT27746.1 hypothetical protein BVAD3_14200 [Bacillus velezensis]
MKFLIVGAGGVGGYIGARLAEKGNDVTFLVRKKRAEQLQETGLTVKSAKGDVSIKPKLMMAGEEGAFDAVIIASKAYSLQDVIRDVKPFVKPSSVIIPFLNGYRHYNRCLKLFQNGRCWAASALLRAPLTTKGKFFIRALPTALFSVNGTGNAQNV